MRQLIRMEAAARRRAAILAAVAVAVLAAAPGAAASHYPPGAALVTHGQVTTLSFLSTASTEANDITVSVSGDAFVITDVYPITVGPGCVHADGNPMVATCAPASAVADIRINSGPADDRVTINAPTNAVLLGRGGNDTLTGGIGNDTLDGYLGNDVLSGGEGNDTADYSSATSAVHVNLGIASQLTGGAGDDTLDSLENVRGGPGSDFLTGDSGVNVINGLAGSDTITSRDGARDEVFCGGPNPPSGSDHTVTADPLDVFPDPSCESVNRGVGPETIIVTKPPEFTNDQTADFTFSSDPPVATTFDCSINLEFIDCANGTLTTPELGEGLYTLEVSAIDGFGNTDQTPEVYQWTVDLTPPSATITATPPALTSSTTASFAFTSNEPVGSFQCQLGTDPLEDCGSGTKEYTGLTAGTYTFSVFAVDRAGNVSTAPDTATWEIETDPPTTEIFSPADGSTHGPSVTFEFTSTAPDLAGFECNLDGSNWVACESPLVASNLADGQHTMSVRAVDKAGNRDPSPATVRFIASVPSVPVQPGGSGSPSVTISRPLPSSLVLIAGRTVRISRRGYASVALNCSGTKACAGRVILSSAEPVRYSRIRRRRIVRLGSAKFVIRAGRTLKVPVHISRRKVKLVRKLRRLPTDVTVRDVDRSGRARVSTRTIVLKALR